MKCNAYKMNGISLRLANMTKCILLFIITFISCSAVGQNRLAFGEKQPFQTISYGEKVAFGTIENSARWTISNTKENVFASLSGNQINNYVFEKPGNYEITFSESKKHEEGECNHAAFPERMIIKVSNIKMTFDFSKIIISEKISSGMNCDGIFIDVPVTVTMKENIPTLFNIPDMVSAGIGAEIIGKPVNPSIIIKPGTQVIRYQLSGRATKPAYLMFDFVDINNQVQSYSHKEFIN